MPFLTLYGMDIHGEVMTFTVSTFLVLKYMRKTPDYVLLVLQESVLVEIDTLHGDFRHNVFGTCSHWDLHLIDGMFYPDK